MGDRDGALRGRCGPQPDDAVPRVPGLWIDEDNPVRVVDAFVDAVDLGELGFDGVMPEATGRPSYHPSVLLKLYIYGYLNRVQSSRRLEREAARNVELMWLTGRLVPDHKTIADFRKENGRAIRNVCALLSAGSVAIDGSKFKAVNTRQAGFRLFAARGRLSVPGWRDAALLLHQRGKRALVTPLLDERLSGLSDQRSMHDG